MGLPLWLSMKCKNTLGKKTVLLSGGLLAVKGKKVDKIIKR